VTKEGARLGCSWLELLAVVADWGVGSVSLLILVMMT